MTDSPPTGEERREIDVESFAARLDAGEVQVIDVRTDEEWRDGHLAGARHLTLNELTAAAETFDEDRAVVFVCAGGSRSAMAADAFRTAGFEAYSLEGGLKAWTEGGRTLESG
jgi:rhodanese-related sulfurtransferase